MDDENIIKQAIGGKINFAANRLTNKPNCGSATATLRYYNLTHENLVISFRDGSYMTLEPDKHHEADGNFYVALDKVSPSDIKVLDNLDNPLSELIRKRINEKSILHRREFYFEESVSLKEIKNAPYGIYLRQSDVCISLEPNFNITKSHPFCIQRTEYFMLNHFDNFKPDSDIGICLRLVDNSGIKQTKYCIFHNKILRLRSSMSPTLEPGLYISGLINPDAEGINAVPRNTFYTIEKAMTDECPFRLFNTTEEANSHLMFLNSMDKVTELQTAQVLRDKSLIEAQNKLQDQENKLREFQYKQADFEQVRLNHIEEIKKLKAEQEMAKLKFDQELAMAELKERYAVESIQNKNKGETIKLIGITVAATASIMKILG